MKFRASVLKVATLFASLDFLVMPAQADFTVSADREYSGQIEGSHNNGGHEHVIWNVTVPSGSIAHVSVFGTMSSVACSSKNAYLVFTGDSEEHYFGGYVDGITYTTTFSESSRVTLYANATPGQYSEPVPVVNPITGAVTYRYRYVTYSSYACTLKYTIKIKYERLPSHTVTYRPGPNGSGSVLTQQKLSGVELQLKGVAFTRNGYSQGGWSKSQDGSTLDYSLCDTYSTEADLTLYPYWTIFDIKTGLVSLVLGGATSVSPGGSITLTCKAIYSDGSERLVTPYWLAYSLDYFSISSDGVLTARPYISGGSVPIIAGFEDNGSAVTKKVDISIITDPKLAVVSLPPNGAGYTSADFDTTSTYMWYFDAQDMPSWVSAATLAISSGSYKGSAYPFTRTRTQYNLAKASAHFYVTTKANNTGDARWWAFTAKDGDGNVLKNFVFLQHPVEKKTVSSLSVSGATKLKSGEKALYRCKASFSNGTEVNIRPKWSVVEEAFSSAIGSDGLFTAPTVTSEQTVTVKASYTSSGVTETETRRVTVKPLVAATYSVSYNPGSYGMGSPVTVTKTAGHALNLKGAIFVRSGYVQIGWAKTDGGSKNYDLDASYAIDEDVTLYPVWKQALSEKIKVAYHPGAYGSGEAYAYEYNRNWLDFIMRGETYSREGYRQTGWSRTDGGIQAFSLCARVYDETCLPSVDVLDLYPVWTAISYESPFQYKAYSDGAIITKYLGPNGAVDIPATLGGRPVVQIGDSAFFGYKWITSITMPAGVQKIAPCAFMDCNDLSSVTIPSSVTEIGGSAFEGCRKLTTVYVDENDEARVRDLMTGSRFDCSGTTFTSVRAYTVTYMPGTDGVGEQKTVTCVLEFRLTLDRAIFSRRGHLQSGWATTEGGPKVYELGAECTKAEDLTLYPVWTETNEYVVSFVDRGNEILSAQFTYGSVCQLPPCTATPPAGKVFTGWACSNGRRYDDGMLVFNLAEPGETVTMTAIWE